MQSAKPSWMTTGKVSSEYLSSVYAQLMKRERARAESRRASRDVIIPSRFQEREPRSGIMRKLHLKRESRSGVDDLSPQEQFYSVKLASSETNQNRNRYSDIEPYDRNCVLVGSTDATSGRYLNASWVRETEGKAWWVAGQAPLFKTTHAFLSLFTTLQPEPLRLHTIVQLTPIAENGIRKADQYLPATPNSEPLIFYPEGECSHLPSIRVSLQSTETIPDAGCTVSTVELKLLSSSGAVGGDAFVVKHVNYEKWPDHSIPDDPIELMNLAQVVSDANASSSPILAHCSAGVGRTGTFIAISSLLRQHGWLPPVDGKADSMLNKLYLSHRQSPLGQLAPPFSEDPVAREVDGLREQRTTMVQRPEQLGIVYQVLITALDQAKHRQ